jgi:hypothetical protein
MPHPCGPVEVRLNITAASVKPFRAAPRKTCAARVVIAVEKAGRETVEQGCGRRREQFAERSLRAEEEIRSLVLVPERALNPCFVRTMPPRGIGS